MAQKLGGTYVEIRARYDKMKKDLDEAKGELEKSNNVMAASVKKFALVLAGAFSVREAYGFATAVFEAGKQMSSLTKSFDQISGSASATKAEFQFLRDLAKSTGQNFYDLTETYKGFLAASKGTNLEGAKTRDIFTAITKASASLGLSSDTTKGALYAVQQMMSKGTVQAEELRGQLGERLPGAFNLMAEAMGVSTMQLGKMLERGEVLADEALPKLADLLETRYPGAAAESVRATNSLAESWTDFKVALSESGIESLFITSMDWLTGIIKVAGSAFTAIDPMQKQLHDLAVSIQEMEAMGPNQSIFGIFSGNKDEEFEHIERLEEMRRQYSALAETIENKNNPAVAKSAKEYKDSWLAFEEGAAAAELRSEKAVEEIEEKQKSAAKSAYDEKSKILADFSREYEKTVLDDYQYAVLMLDRDVKKFRAAGAGKEELARYHTEKLGELQNKYLDVVEGSNNEQYESELTKWHRIDRASMAGVDDAIKRQEQLADETKATASEQADAYRKLYDDLGTASSASYRFKVGLLRDEYLKLREILGDSKELQIAYYQRKKELDQQNMLATGNFLDGMKVAYEKHFDDRTTLAKHGAKIWNDTHQQMADTFGNVFYDAITGDLKDLEDYADAVWKSIAKSFADMLGQLVADWAVSGAKGLLSGDKGASLVSGIIGAAGGIWDAVDWMGSDLLDLWHTGAWTVDQDQVAKLKAGEMVVPPEEADRIRSMLDASGSGTGWGEGLKSAGFGSMGSFASSMMAMGGIKGALSAAGLTGLSGYAADADLGDILDAMASRGISGAVAGLLGKGVKGAFGLTDLSSNIGAVLGHLAASSLGFGTLGPVGAVAATVGAVLGNALADFGNFRSDENMRERAETAFGEILGRQMVAEYGYIDAWMIAPLMAAVASKGAISGTGYMAAMQALAESDPDLAASLGSAQTIGGTPSYDPRFSVSRYGTYENFLADTYGGGMSGGGMSGGQPGLGNTGGGDYGGASRGEGGTIGGLRSGGWATGPTSGYAATLHGTEYVLNQDQIKAIRDLTGGKGGGTVRIYFDSPELARFVRVEAQGVQIQREMRAQRGRRDTIGSTPARVY